MSEPKTEGENWLLVSHYFPPRPGGMAVTYRNLLSHLDQSRIFVLTAASGQFRDSHSDLSCRVQAVSSLWPRWLKGQSYLSLANIPKVARAGVRLAKKHGITRIVATNPDITFFIASYFIHRITGIALYLYLHDTFVEAQTRFQERTLARLFQGRLFKAAKKIFVLSDALAEFYRERYKLETIIIPHCVDEALLRDLPQNIEKNRPSDKTIVFSGAIYNLNLDSVRRLVAAIEDAPYIRLFISSFLSPKDIQRYGLARPNVTVSFLPSYKEVIQLQRRASVLYLPLTFNSPSPQYVDEASTVFPTKLVEYLVSGVPILVHAPENYYLSRFAKREGCALVVGQPDPRLLREGIERLLKDNDLRCRLVSNAFRVSARFRGGPTARLFERELLGADPE